MADPWTRPKFDPEPGKTVLLVIDMQYDFLAGGAPYESSHGREMIGELNGLIQLCRSKAIPVVFTVHCQTTIQRVLRDGARSAAAQSRGRGSDRRRRRDERVL